MSFWNRLKATAAFEAVLLLAVGITNAFVDTAGLNELIFHSPVFHTAVFAILMAVAPTLVRVLGLRVSRDNVV